MLIHSKRSTEDYKNHWRGQISYEYFRIRYFGIKWKPRFFFFFWQTSSDVRKMWIFLRLPMLSCVIMYKSKLLPQESGEFGTYVYFRSVYERHWRLLAVAPTRIPRERSIQKSISVCYVLVLWIRSFDAGRTALQLKVPFASSTLHVASRVLKSHIYKYDFQAKKNVDQELLKVHSFLREARFSSIYFFPKFFESICSHSHYFDFFCYLQISIAEKSKSSFSYLDLSSKLFWKLDHGFAKKI